MGRRDRGVRICGDPSCSPGRVRGDASATARAAADAVRGDLFSTVWRACSSIATRLGPGRGREGMLSHFGALSMLGLFASWATTLIVGFAVLEWAQEPAVENGASPPIRSFYMSGVTFFTLGYGDVYRIPALSG